MNEGDARIWNSLGKNFFIQISLLIFLGSPFDGVRGPGACFSKVPKLFGRISGDIILFVSSKRRRLEARNFAVIFTFIPFTSY